MVKVVQLIVQVVAAFIKGASFQQIVIRTAVFVAGQILLSKVAQALGPKQPKQYRNVTTNYSGTAEPKRAIYGFLRVGGMDLHAPWTSGSDGTFLHTGQVLAYHECDSFGDTYIDATKVLAADIGAITGADTDGVVTASSYKFKNKIWIRRYRGTAAQTVDFILNAAFPASWGASKRGSGVCYVETRRKFSTKVWDSVGQFTHEVYGARVYDPRLDSTNGGAGAQRYADPTTWTWSANVALCAAHYMFALSFGPLISTSRIDWTSLASAANCCDALVAIPGATTQKRYTFNGMVYSSDSVNGYEEVIRDFSLAMLGSVTFHDGKWFFAAGQFDTPSFTIDESDWIGALQPRFSDAKTTRWNAVRPFFFDKDNAYARKPGYVRTNAGYETAFNGERLYRDFDCIGCVDKYEAQRRGEMINRSGQNVVTLTGRLRPAQAGISLGETGYVNFSAFGWSLKTFRVIAATDNMDGSLSVTLKEEQSTDWTDMVAGDYNTPSTAVVPVNVPPIPVISDLTARGSDEVISFDWNVSSNEYHEITKYRMMEGSSKFPYSAAVPVWEGVGAKMAAVSRVSDLAGYFWLDASVASSTVYTPNTEGVLAAATWLNRHGILDPELQLRPGPTYWAFDGGTGPASGTWVDSSQFATGGMFRMDFPNFLDLTDASIAVQKNQRAVSVADQCYEVAVRWRRSNSLFFVTSAAVISSLDPIMFVQLASSNSDGNSVGIGALTAQASIPLTLHTGSGFYLSRALLRYTAVSARPFVVPRLFAKARNGRIEIDRFSMTTVASVLPTSLCITVAA
jgi:hypothetical protein